MGQRRRHERSGPRHLAAHRRLPVLVGTAALAALGFSLVAPSAQAVDGGQDANRQAALVLAAESQDQAASRGLVRSDDTTDQSAQAASAVAQSQARAHTLAEVAAQQAAAAAAQGAGAPAATPSPAPAPAFPATADGYRAYARSKVGAAEFSCLNPLWTKESGWRATAKNPSSTAYGIAQLLDSTWRYTGVAKTSDGFRQVDAGLAYLGAAYGSPCAAWSHEKSKGWY
jgi:hypothetical protein